MMERICTKCDQLKQQADFTPSFWKAGNKTCRKCHRVYLQRRRDTPGTTAYETYKFWRWHRSIRARCKNKGTEYALTGTMLRAMWEAQKGACAITGLNFAPLGTKMQWDSPSVDRIRAGAGYEGHNVRLVLSCVNAFRGQMTDAQMKFVAKRIVSDG